MQQLFSFPRPVIDSMPIVRELDSFTVGIRHVGAFVILTKATGATITFVALPTNEEVEGVIYQGGAGQITFAQGNGCTMKCRGYTGTQLLSNAQEAWIAWKWDPVLRNMMVTGDVTAS